jgi:hypothetical protein
MEVAYGFSPAPAPPETSRVQIVPEPARGFPHPFAGEFPFAGPCLAFAGTQFADCFHNGISQFRRTIPVVHHLFMSRFMYCRPGGEAVAIALGVRLP